MWEGWERNMGESRKHIKGREVIKERKEGTDNRMYK
jgi:hypothetical protein